MAEPHTGSSLAELTLTEVGERINRHLQRMQADPVLNAPDMKYHTRTWPAALHYLAHLDDGFWGRHYELFRDAPPPEPEAPEVRFTCLVRYRGGFVLYGVHRRTEKRVYGEKVAGEGYYLPSFLDRDCVLKWQAGPDDLAALVEARRIRDEKVKAAEAEFRAAVDAVRTPQEPEESDG